MPYFIEVFGIFIFVVIVALYVTFGKWDDNDNEEEEKK